MSFIYIGNHCKSRKIQKISLRLIGFICRKCNLNVKERDTLMRAVTCMNWEGDTSFLKWRMQCCETRTCHQWHVIADMTHSILCKGNVSLVTHYCWHDSFHHVPSSDSSFLIPTVHMNPVIFWPFKKKICPFWTWFKDSNIPLLDSLLPHVTAHMFACEMVCLESYIKSKMNMICLRTKI